MAQTRSCDNAARVDTGVMSLLGSAKLMAFAAISDAARAKAFYQDVLGLRFVAEDGFAVVFDSNGVMLRLSIVGKPVIAPYTVLGWMVADVGAKVKELEQNGVKFERYSFLSQDELGVWTAPDGTARVAWFKDPDGNVLSVSQHQ
jgi:catechol 2,3-dioxygenase-like lactoylglutathione lyase family enzyme